jgi:hypothetical protein
LKERRGRRLFGSVLCFAFGAFFAAGAVPLFTFGPSGKQLWVLFEAQVANLAGTIGVAPWIATTLLGIFAIGGPLALIWLIAGKQVNRLMWLLTGMIGYGVFRMTH